MNEFKLILALSMQSLTLMKNCRVSSEFVILMLVDAISIYIRKIAMETGKAADHAGRSKPCFYDLEHTFRKMKINTEDLIEIFATMKPRMIVLIEEPVLSETDKILGPERVIGTPTERIIGADMHIPNYFPPFPHIHTYRSTIRIEPVDNSYLTLRERHAVSEELLKRTLNAFLKHTNKTISLISEAQTDENFLVIQPKPSKMLASYAALISNDDFIATKIYDKGQLTAHPSLPYRYQKKGILKADEDDEAEPADSRFPSDAKAD